jgi:hypothetical protein
MWAFGFFGFTRAWRRESLSGLAAKACLAGVVVGILALPASASAQTDFTWSGADTVGNSNWSDATNWGGTAPSGSVGTLTFPALTSAACTANPPTDTCYHSNNDLTGLSATGISIGARYFISGNGITLGSGGITNAGVGSLELPVTLSANQTWSIMSGALEFSGNVTGSTDTVTVDFHGNTTLDLSGNAEVGAVTATGSPYGTIILSPVFSENNGTIIVAGPASLNATDGNPVTITGGPVLFAESPSEVGPLTVEDGSSIQVGTGISGAPAGTLAVDGGLTLNSGTSGMEASGMEMFIDQAGTTPSTDYSQVTASGTVNLAGAELALETGFNTTGHPSCPTLHVGDVDTLITTSGSLTGTFGGVPNGTTIPLLGCYGSTAPRVEINYTANAVTATVVTAGSSGTPTGGPSASQILAALSSVLSPHGKNATIIALLKHGGFTFKFRAPGTGRMVINWYFLPKGARLAKARKAKPVTIASGRVSFTKAEKGKITVRLTAKGKRLLRHAKTLKVTSKSTFTPTVGRAASKLKSFTLRR